MKTRMMLLAMLGMAFAGQAHAEEYRVQMLNKAADGRIMVFEPAVVRAKPGDTITFVATDRGHNSAVMKGGVPEGAQTWKGKINEEVSVTLSEPGVYMYQCTPHLGMGMIGAIVVGDPANLKAVKAIKYPAKSKAAAEKIFAEIESGG
ncbi:pseudoazurin [Sinorhizobium medicae]|uniref:pseudoazurin n=1 Tax=Sinorhizobium medicae TaxID=110321 RepID=UPI000FD50E9F|nr:pseudoazurin [Sinorhizobium medicae]MQX95638.1 pseudoazurin [Sinorhizobium medicae]RVH96438.1 pseudoazurin [Sinorhizobium medicae]RVJ62144.1 pseudoazurin [Sinorhizobium medicae]RVJ79347.1 pseudoazurin [Sinorhizobium medicae]RVK18979.1 pseudoazurin [Sinorhizobium medicae]